jgi:hypothetical protein
MSIVRQADDLKSVPDDRLVSEMENPSGMFPPYLVFTEINRREDLRGRFAAEQSEMPTTSMAEEAVAQMMNGGLPPQQPMEQGLGQGMPQDIQGMPPGMPPGMDQGMPPMPPGMDQGIAAGPPMQMMSNGGMVRGFYDGDLVTSAKIKSVMEQYGVSRDEAMAILEKQNADPNPSGGGAFLSSAPPSDRNGLVMNRASTAESSENLSENFLDAQNYFGGKVKNLDDSAAFSQIRRMFPREATKYDRAQFAINPQDNWKQTFKQQFPNYTPTEETLLPLGAARIKEPEGVEYRALTPGDMDAMRYSEMVESLAGNMTSGNAAKSAGKSAGAGTGAGDGDGAGDGPSAPAIDPLADLKAEVKELKDFNYKSDPSAKSNTSQLRAILEELNPAPSRNNMLAQSLMQLGSGLMQSPTWQGGLGKGFDQVSQTVGKYGDDMREYNQRQSITEQALYEADRARAEKFRDNQFRDRKQSLDTNIALAGLEQRANLQGDRLAFQERMDKQGDDYRLLIALNKELNDAVTDDQKAALKEKMVRVQARIDGYGPGGTVLNRGRVVSN